MLSGACRSYEWPLSEVPDYIEILGASTSWSPDLSKSVMGFYCVDILHHNTSKRMGIFHKCVRYSSDLVRVYVYIYTYGYENRITILQKTNLIIKRNFGN